ncbi:MAG: hypothetical protein ACO3B3_08515 [Cyanobium sp.]
MAGPAGRIHEKIRVKNDNGLGRINSSQTRNSQISGDSDSRT